jgi:hypothetical protein
MALGYSLTLAGAAMATTSLSVVEDDDRHGLSARG